MESWRFDDDADDDAIVIIFWVEYQAYCIWSSPRVPSIRIRRFIMRKIQSILGTKIELKLFTS